MKFSDKLIFLRKRRGLTQQELAKLINVSQGSIWQYESGRTSPPKNTQIQIAKALNVKLADLSNDEKDLSLED